MGQLRTNQRIGQAAIRRLNAVSAWLDAGIEGRDICGRAIGAAKLAPGIATALAPRPLAPARRPSPRPVRVAAARRSAAQLSLTVAQLRINQRISQAAVRRANALGVRLSGQLTGGDLLAGTLGQEVLADRLQVIGAVPGPEPAPSRTIVAPRRPGPRGTVRLTASQLRIDQRIARAAVRRANLLIARLEAGLTGEEFAEASIDARRLAPGVVRAP